MHGRDCVTFKSVYYISFAFGGYCGLRKATHHAPALAAMLFKQNDDFEKLTYDYGLEL